MEAKCYLIISLNPMLYGVQKSKRDMYDVWMVRVPVPLTYFENFSPLCGSSEDHLLNLEGSR